MQVGGRVAEVAGGASWRELFEQKIARPLGFTCTQYDVFGAPDNPRIAGGATSCTDDYLRFLRMVLQRGVYEGRRVLSPEAVVQLLADQTGGARIASSPYQNYAQLDPSLPLARYGIGVWRERVDSGDELETASSQGAFGYSPFIDFKRNLIGVLATTSLLPSVMPAYVELQRIIRRQIPTAPLRAAAIVNGASFRAAGAVAPSQIVSLFGEWPSPVARVLFDEIAQTPFFTSRTQANVSTPAALAGRTGTAVQLEFADGTRTPPVMMAVTAADPALFTVDGTRAAKWDQGDNVIGLFGTGFSAQPVTVIIGGRAAEVLYVGQAPGLVPGVTQINVRVPSGTGPGARITVQSGDRVSLQNTAM
jgi:hypothetical protein